MSLDYNTDMSKGAVKFDDGKLRWHLLPMKLLEGVVRVLEYGARKYAAWNWMKNGGMPYTRLLDAVQRHLNAFMNREDLDPESGQSHVDHAICMLLFLKYAMLRPDQNDDRPPHMPDPPAIPQVNPTLSGPTVVPFPRVDDSGCACCECA